MDLEKVGKLIKELREEKKLSQYDLADKMFVDRSLISKWENGRIAVDLKYIPGLCEILGVDIKEIISGERITDTNKDEINKSVSKFFVAQNSKYHKIKTLAISLLIVLFVGIFSFLVYYFNQTYDTTKVYRISGNSENYELTNGILMITRENCYMKIGNVSNASSNMSLYYYSNDEKKIIYEGDSNNVLIDYFGYDGAINLNNIYDYLDKLYLSINNEEMKLVFTEDYKNDSLLMENKSNVIEKQNEDNQQYDNINEKIIKKFKCKNDDICTGNINSFIITYDVNDKIINILDKNILVTYTFDTKTFYYKDDNVEFTLIDGTLNCISSTCNNTETLYNKYYVDVIKEFNK